MKLYKVTFETEILILAEDEKEAITNAPYYVKEETPELIDAYPIETRYVLETYFPKWKGAIPYSAKRQYNVNDRKCEEFVK